ncbi:hypothetical protein QQF64_019565 [Cirrhinus molitorella]|uniref:Uncharacterized protein n=1 Tax=Cirrhinus molitorella TaxID=172907 RepID=A0ABR3LJ53_9TELE
MFNVTVYGISDGEKDAMKGTLLEEESDPGLSTAAVAGICVAVLLIVAAAAGGVIYSRWNCQAGQNGTGIRMQHKYQVTDIDEMTYNGNVEIREKSV